jgi:hypothetical protein
MYPNGRYMTRSPGRHFGPAPGLDTAARNRGDRFNRFVREDQAPTSTSPEGYGMKTPFAPIVAGGMAGVGRITWTTAGNVLAGGPMTGSGSIALTTAGNVSLIASLTGSGAWSLTKGIAGLSGVVTLTGSGAMSINGQGNLGATVPMTGSGSWSLTGSGDVRMKLSMTGGWTPYTTLSPENLAASVWNAALANYPNAGSAGNTLSLAGSGGVDYNALAAAVWAYIIDAGLSAEQSMRIYGAVLAGKVSGAGTGTEIFTGIDGTTVRVTSTVDAAGNRTLVTVNGA